MSSQLTDTENLRDAERLLRAAIRLNTWMLASIFAAVGGLTLMGLTYLSLYRGLPRPGQYLSLLGVFLPGYEVSATGAWIGLLWGALIGALFAIVVYRMYARRMFTQMGRLAGAKTKAKQPMGATLLMDGPALGIALGALAGVGLFVSTNWLVLRGTAAESMHARLLAQYFPGYSVSLPGSVIGAIELFVLVFLASWLLSWIYNSLAARRDRNIA